MLSKSIFLANEQETIEFAKQISPFMQQVAIENQQVFTVYLDGDLGCGKTTFVRGFLRAIGFQGNVKSPTYTLLETYLSGSLNILHFDLYRFNHPSEWEEAGFDEYMQEKTLCFIEWPSQGEDFIPEKDITLSFVVSNEGRKCRITPNSIYGQKVFLLWQHSQDDKF